MNKLVGEITNITSSGNISLVEAKVDDVILSAMIIGNSGNTDFLKIGKENRLETMLGLIRRSWGFRIGMTHGCQMDGC